MARVSSASEHRDAAASDPRTAVRADDGGWQDAVLRRKLAEARRETGKIWAYRVIVLFAALGAWQVAAATWIDPYYITSPSAVVSRLADWASTGVLWTQLWATVRIMLIGFLTGAVCGSVVGFALGLNSRLGAVFGPYIQAFYSIPKVALAPLFILWFGIGTNMKVVLTAAIVFFLVFWTTYAAVRDVEQELLGVVRIMGGNRFDVIMKAVAPGALPGVLQGLKMSVPYALIGTILGELLATYQGMGFLMQQARSQYDTAGVFAALVVLMLLAVLLDFALRMADSYVTRWKI